MQEAAEQSGRVRVPEIAGPVSIEAAFESAPAGLFIVPWEGEVSRSLREVFAGHVLGPGSGSGPVDAVSLLIGPKGGLTEAEIGLLRARGAIVVTLGPRILRSETAAITAISAILYELGELGGPVV